MKRWMRSDRLIWGIHLRGQSNGRKGNPSNWNEDKVQGFVIVVEN
jgi:hypothetical protein